MAANRECGEEVLGDSDFRSNPVPLQILREFRGCLRIAAGLGRNRLATRRELIPLLSRDRSPCCLWSRQVVAALCLLARPAALGPVRPRRCRLGGRCGLSCPAGHVGLRSEQPRQ